MKAQLEKIQPNFGSSFTVRKFEEGHSNVAQWHFHPEYEIVYISNGRGKRHIASSLSYFEDGDLIFLGPNLPHYGFCNEMKEEHIEVVVQLKEDFLGSEFLTKPEMASIRQLFQRAKTGLSFHGNVKKEIGQQLLELTELDNFKKTVHLLDILQNLADAKDYSSLGAKGIAIEVQAQDQQRMDTIYQFVQQNFQNTISLTEVAEQVNMTVPAFCRYFKKLTHSTFTQFLNEYKISHACQLLGEADMTILAVSLESGFNNLSHFNKQFKEVTALTPSEYRDNLLKTVGS